MRLHLPVSLRVNALTTGFVLCALLANQASAQDDYARSTQGTRILEGQNGFQIKVLVEAANLGGTELDLGEITFPAGPAPNRGHGHAAIEIFYILSGQLNHVVNGESHILDPGMVGIVRPGDDVIHHVTSDEPVRALVIWAPGGEADRLAQFFQQRPIEGNSNR